MLPDPIALQRALFHCGRSVGSILAELFKRWAAACDNSASMYRETAVDEGNRLLLFKFGYIPTYCVKQSQPGRTCTATGVQFIGSLFS